MESQIPDDNDPNFGGVDSYAGVPSSQAPPSTAPRLATVRAKFALSSVADHGDTKIVNLHAATGPGNEEWSKYTPSGTIQLHITNPDASAHFVPGVEYFVDFTKA
jgi:hypothetical protein